MKTTVTFCFDTNNLTYNSRRELTDKMRILSGFSSRHSGITYRLFIRDVFARSSDDPHPDTFFTEGDLRMAGIVSCCTDPFILREIAEAASKDLCSDDRNILIIFGDLSPEAYRHEITSLKHLMASRDVILYVISLTEDGYVADTAVRILEEEIDGQEYTSDNRKKVQGLPLVSKEDIYRRGRYMARNHRSDTELLAGIELLKLAAFRGNMREASRELMFAYENFFIEKEGISTDILSAAEHIVKWPDTEIDDCILYCRKTASMGQPAAAARLLKWVADSRLITSSDKALIASLANTYEPDTFEPVEALTAAFRHREIYEASSYLYRYFAEDADPSHFFWLTVPAALHMRAKYVREHRPYDAWLDKVMASPCPFKDEILEHFREIKRKEEKRSAERQHRHDMSLDLLAHLLKEVNNNETEE